MKSRQFIEDRQPGPFRIIFMVFSIFGYSLANANNEVRVYHEETENGYIIYADNPEPCPVSIKVDFQLENLTSNNEDQKIFVLDPHSTKVFISELTAIKPQKFSFQIAYKKMLGNCLLADYDVSFTYYLPFENGKSFTVTQGYFGLSSHQNERALDFNLPKGTPICAARGGIVLTVVEEHSKGCPSAACKEFNNYILVYHPDGTFAEYAHLQQNGARVSKGDHIETGQVIGISGNTGWSNGPHLHFSVFLQRLENRETLETLFKIENGELSLFLEEGKSYRRNYE